MRPSESAHNSGEHHVSRRSYLALYAAKFVTLRLRFYLLAHRYFWLRRK